MATIVHDAEDDAGDITEPVIDLAKEAGATAVHLEHHAEDIAEHETKIKTQEERIAWLESQLMELPTRTTEATERLASELRAELSEAIANVRSQMEESSTSQAESGEHTKPSEPRENKAEHPSLGGRVRRLLHRLV